MSLGELLVTGAVAALVFTPKQLPKIACHIAQGYKRLQYYKQQIPHLLQQFLQEQQLMERMQQAKEADAAYLTMKPTHNCATQGQGQEKYQNLGERLDLDAD